MIESSGKHYVGGEVQYIDNCDPDRWYKLEVDDVLEKLSVDVSRLEYYYLKPGMSLDEGLVRLFDNLSAVEMTEIGVQKGVVDVYAVEANEVVVSQITQENDVDGVGRVVNIGVGTMCVDVGGAVGGESGDGAMDFEGCESGDRAMYSEGCESGMEMTTWILRVVKLGLEIGRLGRGRGRGRRLRWGRRLKRLRLLGRGRGLRRLRLLGRKETEKAKGKGIEKATGKGKGTDGVPSIVAEDDPAEDPSFIDSTTTLVTMRKMQSWLHKLKGGRRWWMRW